jgi:hypothetical protein
MPARTTKIRHDDQTRAKIQAAQNGRTRSK